MTESDAANPFEQPYPAQQAAPAVQLASGHGDSAANSTANSPRNGTGFHTPSNDLDVTQRDMAEQDLGTATYPPQSAPTPPLNESPSELRHKPSRHVQWPAEISSHISIPMRSRSNPASPTHTMEDQGAQDALTRALEAHSSREPSAEHPRYIGPSGSEPHSAAASSDGDHEERMEQMKDKMEVYVDPNETDGLPNIGRTGTKGRANRAAWGLVKSYTTGANAGLRRRRAQTVMSSGQGLAGVDGDKTTAESEKADGGAGGFSLHNPFRARNDISSTEPPIGASNAPPGATAAPGGGILAALIALQQQQANGGDSGATSGVNTPSSFNGGPSSRASSILQPDDDFSDSDEEEAERVKFLAKQREKRERKNFVHSTATAVTSTGKGITKGVGKVAAGSAGAVLGGAGAASNALGLKTIVGGTAAQKQARSRSGSAELSSTANSTAPKSQQQQSQQHQQQQLQQQQQQAQTDQQASRHQQSSSDPSTPGHVGAPEFKKKRGGSHFDLKALGSKFGLDIDDRPDTAKSGAGVFGALATSTANIAGAASPHGTALAPIPDRPGYHLSRYSAPTVATANTSGTESPRSRDGSSTVGHTPPASPGAVPSSGTGSGGKKKPGLLIDLKQMPHGSSTTPKFGFSRPSSYHGDSPSKHLGEYFGGSAYKETEEERDRREWEKEKKRRRKAREKKKAQEVFITMHVAAILERQQFIMKLARSFMMFGAPSHRLEAQMQATARVLEINCQVIYIPGVMLISFGDAATHTSDIKFLKQANGLDLGKLLAAYLVYYNVIYDKISVTEASVELDELMIAGPKYSLWQNMVIGAFASAFIQPSAFYGSFIDCLAAMPLGALLVLVQVVVSRNDLYSSLFEIVIACINAFLAAALASTKRFCFAAVASGSVVLILPGYIVLCGSLELANRSIISGSVRLVYSILYSLFLGFGLAMGSEVYQRITSLTIYGARDYTCSSLRGDVPWYQSTIPQWFYFLTIPGFLLCLALRNGQPLYRKETILMLMIGSAGFSANFFSGKAFPGRSDIVSAIGSFVVGFLGNLYGKFTRGSPFVVMVAGVLLQLPSGLANGGLLQFAADSTSEDSTAASRSYSSGFSTAQSLVEVAIGLTVGLFVSAAVVNSLGGGRRRGTNLSSF